jgi:hypothetical protein
MLFDILGILPDHGTECFSFFCRCEPILIGVVISFDYKIVSRHCIKSEHTNSPKRQFFNYYYRITFYYTSPSSRKIFENFPLPTVDNQKFPSPLGGRG